MLNNDQATERPELAELFWMRPHQLLGCAGCTRSHKNGSTNFGGTGNLYFCRKCAAESWAHERRKVHPLEWQQHFEEDIFRKDDPAKIYAKFWNRHEFSARMWAVLRQSQSRSIRNDRPNR